MELEIGNEQKFADFIGDLNGKDKIALISHTDPDGIVSALVVNSVIEADFLKFCDYKKLNGDLSESLKNKGINKIIFSDLCVENEEFLKSLEKFANVLILDHHPTTHNWNSERTTYLKAADGYCAAYMCYKLFSKIKNLEKMDWIVACACIADWMYFKNSDWMSEVFRKYGEEFSIDKIKEGKFWELQWNINLASIYFIGDLRRVYDELVKSNGFSDIGELGKYSHEVQEEIDNALDRFKEEKRNFNGGYYWEFSPRRFNVRSIVNTLASAKEPDKTYIFLNRYKGYCSIGARRQDKKDDMGILLKKLTEGFENSSAGGHVPAAGAHFMEKDLPKFQERLGVEA